MMASEQVAGPRNDKARLAEEIARARAGDFNAYMRLNGYMRSSTAKRPRRLMAAEHQKKQIRNQMAHLICKSCGKYHLQDMTPVVLPAESPEKSPLPGASPDQPIATSEVAVLKDGRVISGPLGSTPADAKVKWTLAAQRVTCPHCGQVDCAGPNNHFDHEFRGAGKTELTAHEYAYIYALMRVRGMKAEGLIIGANQDEAKKRLRLVATILRRDGNFVVFPEVRPILKSTGVGVSLRFEGDDEPSLYAYGIEGVPPGFHADLLWCDDVCNQTNTLMRPGLMIKIISKYNDVIEYSQQPWTVVFWSGTPWRENDLDHRMEQYASAHPLEWTYTKIACGGEEDGFRSAWPEKWPPHKLRGLHERDPVSYRRAMQLHRIQDADVIFKSIRYWLDANDPKLKDCPPELLKDVPQLRLIPMPGWPVFIGVDTAYTGEDAPSKKGRSKTGVCAATMDPETKNIFELYTWEGHVAAGGHVALVSPLCERFQTKDVMLEIGGALSETVERFTMAGYTVETYNLRDKVYGGSKTMRKIPVASDFNEGRAFIKGRIVYTADGTVEGVGQWTIEPDEAHRNLDAHMRSYPSQQFDDLDALEISLRCLRRAFGFAPAMLPPPPPMTVERRPWMQGGQPPKDEWKQWDRDTAEQLSADLGELVDVMGFMN
jgi:hypothetical protein